MSNLRDIAGMRQQTNFGLCAARRFMSLARSPARSLTRIRNNHNVHKKPRAADCAIAHVFWAFVIEHAACRILIFYDEFREK